MSRIIIFLIIGVFVSCDKSSITQGDSIGNGIILPQITKYPAWSPNGKYIAYYHTGISNIDDNGLYIIDPSVEGLYIIEADGSNNRMLIAGDCEFPSWSPESDWIVFTQNRMLYKFQLSTDSLLNLIDFTSCSHPAWNPLKSTIAFESNKESTLWDLWVTDTSGITNENLFGSSTSTNDRGWRKPSWYPDGINIVHVRYQPGTAFGQLYVFNTENHNTSRLISNQNNDSEPSISKDGERIAFTSKLDGKGDTKVILCNLNDMDAPYFEVGVGDYPSWSPDGKFIAYTKHSWSIENRSNGHIWVYNVEDDSEYQLTFYSE